MTKAERIARIRELVANATPGSWAVEIGAYPLGVAAREYVGGRQEFIGIIAELKPGTKSDNARMMAWGKSSCEFLLAELARTEKVIDSARKVVDHVEPVVHNSLAWALREYDDGK